MRRFDNQRRNRCLAACIASWLVLGLPVAAQELGNPDRGRISAGDLCSECHRTEPGPGQSPLATAPPFSQVAKTKGMSSMALNVWLHTSHPTMPNIMLKPDTVDDIIAYIMSLRAAASPATPSKRES